jgi:hypothetical protein
MKKIISIVVGSLLISLGSIQAQERDTTRTNTRTQSGQQQKAKDKTGQDNDQARQPRTNQTKQGNTNTTGTYNAKDVEIIQNENVPASLREALQDEKYAGWENAVIYHNKKTGEYLVSPRAHRFDSEGNPIDYPGAKPSKNKTKDNTSGQSSDKNKSSDKTQSGTQQSDEASSQQRQQSQYGNDQSGQDRRKTETQTSGDRTSSQTDTTQSSQSQVTTDQGRQQSTSGRMQQDQASEKSSEGQYGNQAGQDKRTDNTSTQPQQSERYRTDKNDSTANDNAAAATEDPETSMEGMIQIEMTQAPNALRETLKDAKYKGWENGKLYRHESTDEFVLVIQESDANTGSQTTYHFDKDGKAKEGSSNERNK